MDARFQSEHQDKCLQIFVNKDFYIEACKKKIRKDSHEGLDKLFKKYGAPDKMIFDGYGEQVRKKTEFQRKIRKYKIKGHAAKPNRLNQNQ